MNGELFPVKQVRMLSPRLAWCKRHAVVTQRHPRAPADEQWSAYSTKLRVQRIGRGATEEEACRDFGAKSNVRLWNEIV